MTASPLGGKRVVVTQAQHQAPELGALLAARGAEPLYYPCIAIEPPADPTELDKALAAAAAGRYDWLAITSANTVVVIAGRLRQMGLRPGSLRSVRVAAIGTASAAAVEQQWGRGADLVAEDSTAEGLAQALIAANAAAPGAAEGTGAGQRVLLPQADIARPVLAQALGAAGLAVTQVAAYRTTMGSGGVPLSALLGERRHEGSEGSRGRGGVDAITFTSASTVRNLLARLAQEGGEPARLRDVVLACIGPITAGALCAEGFQPAVVAREQSLAGLVEALSDYYRDTL